MTPVKVPRYIDNPIQVGLWELDEVIPLVAAIGIGIAFKMLFVLAPIGYVMTRLIVKSKSTGLRGVIQHAAFFYGFTALNKVFDNGLKREFIE